MSMTAVPISIFIVRALTAARSGNGEPSWRAKGCTRKDAPFRPSSSAATANSIDCRRASEAVRTSEYGTGVQWPKDRNPILFTQGTSETGMPQLIGLGGCADTEHARLGQRHRQEDRARSTQGTIALQTA